MFDFTELPWPEPVIPAYPDSLESGDWRIERTKVPLLRGYFRGLRPIQGAEIVKLFRGNVLWMSTTPMEFESQQHAISRMKGRVAIAGAGMGITVFNALQNPEVEEVMLFEIDLEVLKLLAELHRYEEWPHWEKLKFFHGDAKDAVVQSLADVDFLWVDIWMNLGSVAAVEETVEIQSRIQAREVGWWGMEIDFVDFMRTSGRNLPPSEADWRAFVKLVGIPIMEIENHWDWAIRAVENIYLA